MVVLIVNQRDISHSQPVKGAQNTDTISDLVQTLDADQTRDPPTAKYGKDVGCGVCEGEDGGILFDHAVNQVDLLQRVVNGLKGLFVW